MLVGLWARIVSPLASTSWETETGAAGGVAGGGPNSCENGGSAIGPEMYPGPWTF